MGGLGIAFRRRTQYKKKVEKVEIEIYATLTLSGGAQMLLPDIFFRDNIVECQMTFSGTQYSAVAGVDVVSETAYRLAGVNNGSYKNFSNGKTSATQKFISGSGPFVIRWQQDGVYRDGVAAITEERTPREWAIRLSLNGGRLYYLNVYDSTGTNLLHSLKPALLNKETPGLWDEINKKFYGMTSESGELTLA